MQNDLCLKINLIKLVFNIYVCIKIGKVYTQKIIQIGVAELLSLFPAPIIISAPLRGCLRLPSWTGGWDWGACRDPTFLRICDFCSCLHQILTFHIITSTTDLVFMERHALCMEGRGCVLETHEWQRDGGRAGRGNATEQMCFVFK